jgi:hypothetical protein
VRPLFKNIKKREPTTIFGLSRQGLGGTPTLSPNIQAWPWRVSVLCSWLEVILVSGLTTRSFFSSSHRRTVEGETYPLSRKPLPGSFNQDWCFIPVPTPPGHFVILQFTASPNRTWRTMDFRSLKPGTGEGLCSNGGSMSKDRHLQRTRRRQSVWDSQ